jgi:putative endonuclease
MKGWMYILECSDGSFYTGSTIDLLKRFDEHQAGFGANHTSKRLPVKLIYFEDYDRIDAAFYREKQIQGWSKAKKMALMQRNFNKLHDLAACMNNSHSSRYEFEKAIKAKIEASK